MKKINLARRLTAGLAALSLAGLLAACSLFNTSANRGDDGDITSGGSLDVFSVAVGDCFIVPDGETVSEIAAMPCSQAHDAEFVGKVNVTLAAFDKSAISDEAESFCLDAMDSYVGPNWMDTPLDLSWLLPTEGSWSNGDREIACFAYSDDVNLTASVRGMGA
ncbi:MAG: septum formation family protein [Propionibacteriaceae bacterium]|jgi:hypothetical protein|nr:septum formation family protein [Propionibacteriaceae bacterium]